MSDQNMRHKIYLAALLHDVGKFWQRASRNMNEDKSNLSGHTKELCEYICPKDKEGRFQYKHVLWTSQFFDTFNKHFPESLRSKATSEVQDHTAANLASYHHYPKTELQALIALADRWSSGSDRLQDEEFTDENDPQGNERFRQVHLRNIFDILDLSQIVKNGLENNGPYYYELQSYSVEKKKLFPKEEKELSPADYAAVWEEFEKDLNNYLRSATEGVSKPDARSFIETLYYLLKKHTYLIPSDVNETPRVTSLFQHLKTTAAFASALYDYREENPDAFEYEDMDGKWKAKVREQHFPLLFFGGDISGIQSFIYDIHHSKAAKSLKGRSFYINLLADAIIRRILFHPDIQLNFANVLYDAGGKFYLILPNTGKVRKALVEIVLDVEKELFEDQNGTLAFVHATLPIRLETKKEDDNKWITKAHIEGEDEPVLISRLWHKLGEKLQPEKERKFANYLRLNDKWRDLFKPQGTGGDVRTDAVTGLELSGKMRCLENGNEVEGDEPCPENLYVSREVYQQIQLGTVLKDVDYIIVYKGQDDAYKEFLKGKTKAHIRVAGIDYYLFDQIELIYEDADFRKITSFDYGHVIRINDTDFIVPIKGLNMSYGFKFYGGNKQAEKNVIDKYTKKKKEKTFNELTYFEEVDLEENTGSKDSLSSEEHTYFSVLRMDVDNLGRIFFSGLGDKATFAAMTTMSDALDAFFSGYLNIIRNREDYKDYVNIVYSGGDDLFIVGRWDKVLEMAMDIRKEFYDYTKRPDMSISGGMVMVPPKFPIHKAADLAADAEHKAKAIDDIMAETTGPKEKDAFTVFDEAVKWKEWTRLREEDDYLSIHDEYLKYLPYFGNRKWKEFCEREEFAGMSFCQIVSRFKEPFLSKSILQRIRDYYLKFKEGDQSVIWHTTYFLARQIEKYMERKEGKLRPKEGKEAAVVFLRNLQKDLVAPEQYRRKAIVFRWIELTLRDLEKRFKLLEKQQLEEQEINNN